MNPDIMLSVVGWVGREFQRPADEGRRCRGRFSRTARRHRPSCRFPPEHGAVKRCRRGLAAGRRPVALSRHGADQFLAAHGLAVLFGEYPRGGVQGVELLFPCRFASALSPGKGVRRRVLGRCPASLVWSGAARSIAGRPLSPRIQVCSAGAQQDFSGCPLEKASGWHPPGTATVWVDIIESSRWRAGGQLDRLVRRQVQRFDLPPAVWLGRLHLCTSLPHRPPRSGP